MPAAVPRQRSSLSACHGCGFTEGCRDCGMVETCHQALPADRLDQFLHRNKRRHLNNNEASVARCCALHTGAGDWWQIVMADSDAGASRLTWVKGR